MMNSSSEYSAKKSWRTGKTSGWAAFDLEQQRKLSLAPYINNEPFPPISRSVLGSSGNVPLLEKPFASVVHNPMNFLTSADAAAVLDNMENTVNGCTEAIHTNRTVNKIGRERSELKAREMLKECYPWADGGLIDDVLAGVDNDMEQASNVLKGMLLTESNCMTNEDVESEGPERLSQELSLAQGDKSREPTTTTLFDDGRKCSAELSDNSAILKIIQNYLNSVPLEPEWEEDDVYWVHRKDALKMMRSAARHSKAATDYYNKGEHALAQQHSLKAREEWTTANRLNDMAAKEILKIRNAKNDVWTLDLHGLHAFEAVRALEEHLRKIESVVPVNQLKSSTNPMEEKSGIVVVPASRVSISCSDLANMDRRPLSSLPSSRSRPRPRRPPLQVITGKGNHSRGEAAIPLAVRRFLIDNGYQFDETRPGMITVRPKFRV